MNEQPPTETMEQFQKRKAREAQAEVELDYKRCRISRAQRDAMLAKLKAA